MQVYVQKLISTTFPRSAFVFSAPELSQPTAPPKSGMDDGRWLCEKRDTPTNPAAMARMPILKLMMRPRSRLANDAPGWQRQAKLLSARIQLVAQQRCIKRRVHEPG